MVDDDGQGVVRDIDVLAVGEINPDIVIAGAGPLPAFGDPELLVDAISLTVGSSTAIFACGAARLGLRTAMYGVAGDDTLGRYMVGAMRERGVDVSEIRLDLALATGATVILAGAGERAFMTAMGSIGAMDVDAIPQALLSRTRHLHSASFFLQATSRARLPAFLAEARSRGITTSVDTNWDPTERWDRDAEDMIRNADVFLPNRAEAQRIAGIEDVEAAARHLARVGAAGRADGGPLVVVKLGAEGALACDADGELVRVPAFRAQARDTTGAGDSFDAGFICAWLERQPLEACLRLAAVCGASSVEHLGGVDGQPTRAEAGSLLSSWTAATS